MIAWLVETLIVTSALMALVLLMRVPVRHAFGAKVAYALWLLPALRLLMPRIDALMPQALPLAGVAPPSGALSQLIRARVMQLDDVAPTAAGSASGLLASTPWPLVLATLWLLGVVAFVMWQVVSYRRFCRQVLSGARARRSPARGIRLIASPHVSGPLAFGLTRRFIVFPQDAIIRFDVEEHAMALAHEMAHHRRGDLIANAVALGFLALHWWNPLAWFAHRAFRTDQEMACDADVIAAIRDQGLGHAYGRALVKCAAGREFSAICHLTTVDRLKRRLSMLSRKSPSARRRLTGLAVTSAIMIGGLAFTASGEGMAARVGTKVSEALPIPRKADLLPSFPAIPSAHATQADDAPRMTDRSAGVDARLNKALELAAALDAPPAPPAPPAVTSVPPSPPAPPAIADVPAPPAPPAPPAVSEANGSHYRHVVRIRDGKIVAPPSKAEIDAMVPLIEVKEARQCAGGDAVNTSEETVAVDGKERRQIRILICGKAKAQEARAQALKGLQSARNSLADETALSGDTRRKVLADLDRQIARMRAERD